MGHYEESIIINASPEKVYDEIKDVVGYLQRVPGYNVNVLEQSDQKILAEVSSHYFGGIKFAWHTLADISNPKGIQFEQVRGPLKGLTAGWEISSLSQGTKLTITHDFEARIPGLWIKIPIISKPVEKWLYGYTIKNVAEGILQDMRARLET